MFEKLKEFHAMKEAYQAKLRSEGRTVVESILVEFLKANPKITALRWDQFTPFFCDGDPCYFGVRSINCQVAEEFAEKEIKYSDGDRWTEDGAYGLHKDSSLFGPLKQLDTELHAAADLLEVAFGDHITVTATLDGITTRDCSDHH